MIKKICCAVAIILLFTNTMVAQIRVALPDTVVAQNSQVLIPIRVSDLTGLEINSFQFTIQYDKNVVTALSIDRENTLSQSWGQIVSNFNVPGVVEIGAYDVTYLTGKGNLINMLFKVIGQPKDTTKLVFKYCELAGDTAAIIKTNGRIKVDSDFISVTITANIVTDVKVKVDDTLRTVPYKTEWLKRTVHKIEAPSPQEAGIGKRYQFTYWSDGGAQTHDVSPATDISYIANYDLQFKLTIISEYGNPQGQGWYNSGSQVTFSVDSLHYESNAIRRLFTGWTGSGGGSYSGSKRMKSVVMNNAITEQAHWRLEYLLRVNSVQGNPFGGGWYVPGSSTNFGIEANVILKPTEQYFFQFWTGEGNGSYAGTNLTGVVIMNNPITETAHWNADFYVQTGAVPTGIVNVAGTGWYSQGYQFKTMTAPDSIIISSVTYYFKDWTINGKAITGNPIIFTVDTAIILLANYARAYKIRGIITSNGSGLKEAQIVLKGIKQDTTASDQNGYYQFKRLFEGLYEIIPQKTGYVFEPAGRRYEPLNWDYENQNFSATYSSSQLAEDFEQPFPQGITLQQNYPNPFNNATVISYQIPRTSHVSLQIYDLSGRIVKSLYSGIQRPGFYHIFFNGEDDLRNPMPSGIYLYKLEVDQIVLVRKMTLLR